MLISRSLYQGKYTSPLKHHSIFLIEPTPVTSLWYFLHSIPDYRRAQGKRHNLTTILILAILAIASGAVSYQSISEWPRNYEEHLKEMAPYLWVHIPDKSTFHRVFANLNIKAFEQSLGSWLQTITHTEKGEGIAIDAYVLKRSAPLQVKSKPEEEVH